ncbi:cytidine deaminase [Cyclobacterium qasimii]|uniref:Cytidine deaminase n=2 Tax=Cyclobacterium qasimii TaxID=1350429 RepID=S7WHS9_9BACT|nr:cytidine deaminase [Cyclobacterium qasimii]EPR66279.1 Cytidine deaminase [Cyclobacterium qasimii M12-11B]GEO21022.1 cytidine deaminase [Cyclobacterium qasimii]
MKENKKVSNINTMELIPAVNLNEMQANLIELAIKASDNAYAPYSNFRVGAAVILADGQTFWANNQENIAYPAGICAERVLLCYTHSNYPKLKPLTIAIVAKKANDTGMATVTPCGMCRQTISEYEMKFDSPIEILMLRSDGSVLKAEGIDQLLPYKLEDLNV